MKARVVFPLLQIAHGVFINRRDFVNMLITNSNNDNERAIVKLLYISIVELLWSNFYHMEVFKNEENANVINLFNGVSGGL